MIKLTDEQVKEFISLLSITINDNDNYLNPLFYNISDEERKYVELEQIRLKSMISDIQNKYNNRLKLIGGKYE